MIHFNDKTRTFNLILANSVYAFRVDRDDRLLHLGWAPRPPAAGDDAFIAGERIHEIEASPFSFIVQFRPDELLTFGDVTTFETTLKVTFPTVGQPLAAGEAPHLPVRDVRLRYRGHEVVTDGRPGLAPKHGLSTARMTPRETLRVTLADPIYPFTVTVCYRLTPDHDILERWLELENHGSQPVTIEHCYFASLHLPNDATELTTASGLWAREFMTERRTLTQGTQLVESRSVQTSHHANPFFMLNRPGQAWEESGTVYFGALAFSGAWQLAFERLPTWEMRVHGGYNPFDFELILQPGESHKTPAFITGVADDGWGGASRRLHALGREFILPAPGGSHKPRPVLYNSWEATYFDLSTENQIELARKAAAMGVELFCLDDGWFGGRRHDQAGLGDWVVSPEVFPNGLGELVDEVHRLGMRFGLWVEPEMVNPDSDLYRTHPDWVLHFPGRERTEARSQLILDLGRPEVVEYLYGLLDQLVDQYQVSFFKWDMNRLATEPGSVAGRAIWFKHAAAVYQIMDRLRAKYPTLDIQSCSGGGGRIDYGILGRTDQVWTSDNTDALDRIWIQEGFSMAYPARAMEAWVTHEKNHITQRVTTVGVRFDVAMRGVLGIGSSLHELDDQELAEYRRYITFYKQFRHVVQDGELYRLMRMEESGKSIIQYVLPDGSEAVVSAVVGERHQVGAYRGNPPLKRLQSAVTYRVMGLDNHELYRLSGYELMTLGLPAEMVEFPGYSRTLHLVKV